MEKRTVFLELPCELIDKIDMLNNIGDRSSFITSLLEKQLRQSADMKTGVSSEFTSRLSKEDRSFGIAGEIDLVDCEGFSLGKFNINTVQGFEDLAKKIEEVSEDPIVRIRARRLL